jgi:hypothetical protein
VRGAALATAGDCEGALRSLRQSLHAAKVRDAEYETALTMRVLAAVEPDADEREILARSAHEILTKLKVVWTPDLLSAPPGSGAEAAVQSGA